MTHTTFIIIINVVADLGILGLLAHVMSRAARLKPHRPEVVDVPATHSPYVAPRAVRRSAPRPTPRPSAALD